MERKERNWARGWIGAAVFLMGLLFAADLARLYTLHLGKAEIPQNNYLQERDLLGLRGRILDRNGRVLAESLSGRIVYIDREDPKLESPDIDRGALPLDLAALLNVPEERVYDAFYNTEGRRTTRICEISDNETIQALIRRSSPSTKEGRIAGVNFAEKRSVRSHPNGARLAHLIGFINAEGVGVQGVEQRFDEELRGKDGRIVTEVDARRREIPNRRIEEVPAVHGNDVILTIDNNIQYIIEPALAEALKTYQADSGTIIVQDVHTGEILGMATQPSFDPQDYNHMPQEQWKNIAVARNYEPGSVMKAITVAMAMQFGIITEDSTFDIGTSRVWYYGGHRLRDHAAGILRPADILAKSSNIGTAMIGLKMAEPSPDFGMEEYARLWYAFRAIGLGQKTGIELPGEEAGILPHYKNWSKLSPTRMTLGQGIAVTPVQLCNAFATIANGGKLMRPTILREIRTHEGELVRTNTQEIIGRPLTPEVSAKVLDMLRGVTDRSKGGTGWRAALHDYTVAGKTGTGQIPINGRYNDTDYNATFVGIFPSTAPRLAILVTLERPKGPRHSGGNVAAPIFAQIAEPIGHYMNIPADKPQEALAP